VKINFGHADTASASGEALTEALSGIVRTPSVDQFLQSDSFSFVVGAKGTGKTLLLLKKAVDRMAESSVLTIPNNRSLPVDRLTADEDLGISFSRKATSPSIGRTAWIAAWKHALLKACLYNLLYPSGKATNLDTTAHAVEEVPLILPELAGYIRKIFGHGPFALPKAVFDFYIEVMHALDEGGMSTIAKIRDEVNLIRQLLRLSSKPIFVFIDNLDTYYESNPSLWFDSMDALLKCVREIRLEFRDIHIFASLRKDIFNQVETVQRQQLLDFLIELKYSRDDLLAIFKAAVFTLKEECLHFPLRKADDPLQAFFGDEKWILNHLVHDGWDTVGDYLLKHTLHRPRDIITLGNALLQEKRGTREMNLGTVRNGVLQGSREIRRQYFMELVPQLPKQFSLLDFIQEFTPSNVFTDEDLSRCLRRFAQSSLAVSCDNGVDEHPNPFSALWTAGLLGHFEKVDDHYKQRFALPGEHRVSFSQKVLRRSLHYCLHPILNDLLNERGINRQIMTGYDQKISVKELR
jgi:hypothetical protein